MSKKRGKKEGSREARRGGVTVFEENYCEEGDLDPKRSRYAAHLGTGETMRGERVSGTKHMALLRPATFNVVWMWPVRKWFWGGKQKETDSKDWCAAFLDPVIGSC